MPDDRTPAPSAAEGGAPPAPEASQGGVEGGVRAALGGWLFLFEQPRRLRLALVPAGVLLASSLILGPVGALGVGWRLRHARHLRPWVRGALELGGLWVGVLMAAALAVALCRPVCARLLDELDLHAVSGAPGPRERAPAAAPPPPPGVLAALLPRLGLVLLLLFVLPLPVGLFAGLTWLLREVFVLPFRRAGLGSAAQLHWMVANPGPLVGFLAIQLCLLSLPLLDLLWLPAATVGAAILLRSTDLGPPRPGPQ